MKRFVAGSLYKIRFVLFLVAFFFTVFSPLAAAWPSLRFSRARLEVPRATWVGTFDHGTTTALLRDFRVRGFDGFTRVNISGLRFSVLLIGLYLPAIFLG